jgi:glycosyltransferase involved in cell wall biosynthesis
MPSPLLSVVIPTWNRVHIVCDAIESALTQRPGDVEVIVVDDCSTDKTVEVLGRSFGSRIELLQLPVRRGPGAARNAGILLASGRLVAFLDSDDTWLPGKLDAELDLLQRFPEAEAVITDSQSFIEGEAEDRTRFMQNGLYAITGGRVCWLSDCNWLWTNSQNGVATCSITLRRDVLARIGRSLFAEDLIRCEDWEFELRVYHLCRVIVLPRVWSHVRSFDDGSRLGRPLSGIPTTREQEVGLLRDRLTVMERSHWLSGLKDDLAAEFERFRAETTSRLAQFARCEE